MEKLLKVLGGTVLWIGLVLYGGLVLVDLWQWFVVPFGVATLSLPHALGLRLLAAYSTYTHVKQEVTFLESVTYGYLMTLFSWLFGAIYHSFM